MACNLNYMRRRMQLAAQPHKAKASGAVATFRTNLAARLDSLFVDVTPVQDLHGQQYPYPPGGGKNMTPPNAASSGSASGVDWVANSDGGVKITGTSSAAAVIWMSGAFTVKSGVQYALNGCPGTGDASTYRLDLRTNANTLYRPDGTHSVIDYGTGVTFTPNADAEIYVCVRVGGGYAIPTSGVTFYPMVRLATVTDATFAPYSNICPITGWAAAKVESAPNMDIGTLYNNGLDDYGEVNTYTYYWHTDYIDVRNAEQVEIAFYAIDGGWTYRACAYDANKQFIELLDKKTHSNGRAYSYTYDSAALDGVAYLRFSFIKNGSNPTVKHFAVVDSLQVIQFGQTLYGARIDWNGRKAVCTDELIVLDGTSIWVANGTYGYYLLLNDKYDVTTTPVFNYLKALSPGGGAGLKYWEGRLNYASATQRKTLLVKPGSEIDHATKWTEYRTNNPLYVLLKLVDPVEIPLDLVDFVTVPGINNVFADCGNTDLSYWTNV